MDKYCFMPDRFPPAENLQPDEKMQRNKCNN